MYVSVPKNYSGMAFPRENRAQIHPDVVHPAMPLPEIEEPREHPKKEPCKEPEPPCDEPQCKECRSQDKNPLTCLMHALRNRNKGGFESEDFLLLGLIVLLLGKEGNEDILLILAMLLLI